MTDSVLNVVLGLVATAISASLGWLAQNLRRRRRLGRVREFFGMPGGSECLLVVNRHTASNSSKSVSRNDVFALMELSALVKECGAQAELVTHDEVRQGLGHKAEFCLGGPASNDRTAAHLASWLPGVRFAEDPVKHHEMSLVVGAEEYAFESPSRTSGGRVYALLARIQTGHGGRPAFLIAGQTATSNHAAVRYLVANHRKLARTYGTDGTFALVLRLVNSTAYGPDLVELVADVTRKALAPPEAPATPAAVPAQAPAPST
ncbi:hypothetical protein ACFRKE_08485 [Kitasatospora indigofera]|uniref:Secreted protein n=1 Tax=Kitasatospora indigofera TaxID=67307 RepID=A0A919G4D4_9ACTN|nr:hypothetical protein [Kitasatospora indigofera]GHH76950.1 hypothetical protein GCM10018781_49310 [Kitasatospora indigofera]